MSPQWGGWVGGGKKNEARSQTKTKGGKVSVEKKKKAKKFGESKVQPESGKEIPYHMFTIGKEETGD